MGKYNLVSVHVTKHEQQSNRLVLQRALNPIKGKRAQRRIIVNHDKFSSHTSVQTNIYLISQAKHRIGDLFCNDCLLALKAFQRLVKRFMHLHMQKGIRLNRGYLKKTINPLQNYIHKVMFVTLRFKTFNPRTIFYQIQTLQSGRKDGRPNYTRQKHVPDTSINTRSAIND